jgi:hypothetical protein
MVVVNLFIIYASEDAECREELRKHLSYLKEKVNVFYDGLIAPGVLWDKEIQKNIRTSDIIVMLLSSDSTNSDYINDVEMPIARERHDNGECRLIPILIKNVNLPSYCQDLQYLAGSNKRPVCSKNKNRDDEWVEVAKQIGIQVDVRAKVKENMMIHQNAMYDSSFIKELSTKISEINGFCLCARTGLGWWKEKNLKQRFDEMPKVIRNHSKMLFLDPNSNVFKIDTNMSWIPVNKEGFADKAQDRQKEVEKCHQWFKDMGYQVKITDAYMLPTFWILSVQQKEQKKRYEGRSAYIELPVRRDLYGGNLYVCDLEKAVLYSSIFDILWESGKKI